MSELIQKNDNRATIRWKLLTGASALTLTAHVWGMAPAYAEDSGRPSIWLELGGQLSRLEDGQEMFSPPVMDARPSIFLPSQPFERSPLYSIDEEGKISFQPQNSDWIFSASMRYGRSANHRDVHQQTYPDKFSLYFLYYGYPVHFTRYPEAAKFADTESRTSERHMILDFQAGRDVGLGIFNGKSATSTVSVGVRFAQFSAKTNTSLKSDPDWQFLYFYNPSLVSVVGLSSSKVALGSHHHSNAAALQAARSFHGIGPSISWTASAPFAGNTDSGELTLDWGVNAALLFGKQRAKIHHQSSEHYYRQFLSQDRAGGLVGTPQSHSTTRTRNVTVPNVGGFAGISFNYPGAKVSLGYRADFFFNAIDGGIDARKNENRGFFGPYASISIGLGD